MPADIMTWIPVSSTGMTGVLLVTRYWLLVSPFAEGLGDGSPHRRQWCVIIIQNKSNYHLLFDIDRWRLSYTYLLVQSRL